MPTDLTELDPQQAWAPYTPDAQRPWNIRRAAHLYRRAAFGADYATLTAAVDAGPATVIDALFTASEPAGDGANQRGDGSDAVAAFDRQMESLSSAMMGTGDPRALSASWLYRMVNTPAPLLERVTLCWHDHFATSAAKVTKSRLMLDHLDLLRSHALGAFEPFVQAISRDPAMLIWLDSTVNRRVSPNENYAREVMELFCLGVGHYTEDDIKQVARAFTGWEVHRDRFTFNKFQHDTRDKTFLGHTGDYDGDDAIRIILAQPAASRHIARKLARAFVCDEPELPDTLIQPLADQLRDNGFVIAPVVRRILSSSLFFSEHAIGRKVRSPVTLGVGMLRAFDATTNMNQLAAAVDTLGQLPLFPPSVKGWDGGRTWINSSTLLGRANLARAFGLGGQVKFNAGSLAATAAKHGVTKPADAVNWMLDLIVPLDPPADVRDQLVAIASGPGDENQRLGKTLQAIGTLPEFNLA